MKDIYTLGNIKRVTWGVLEENQPISLYPVMYPGWLSILEHTGEILGKKQKSISCIHRRDHGVIFIDHKEWTALGEYALRKILKNPKWGVALNKKILRLSDALTKFSHNMIAKVTLQQKSNKELYRLYRKYEDRHNKLYDYAIIPVYLDLYKPHLTTHVVQYLAQQVRKVHYAHTAKECFSLLTVPRELSKVQLEEVALLRIADYIRKVYKGKRFTRNRLPRKLKQRVQHHAERFRFLGYNFEGPAFPHSYFWRRVREFVADDISPSQKILRIMHEKKQAQILHRQIVRDLHIDRKYQKLISITQGFIFSKDYRKMSLVQSYYELEPLLTEIGKRVHLTIAEVRNCLLHEIDSMLTEKTGVPKDLTKRMHGCFFVVIDGKLPGKVFVDRTYTAMRKYLLKKEDLTQVNYFHGQTASLGKASGVVRIINSTRDLRKMKKGNILVAQMTNPDVVPAMKKAAAIITDLGGITCHAAIVSRELKIPCVIGTKVATKVLQDGDRVEVDANKGDIRKI